MLASYLRLSARTNHMSVQGSQKDNIRASVQPLLDAIAAESPLNLLELKANIKERQEDPSISAIKPIGWQDSFFENKIRQPLDLDMLKYNGIWAEKATRAEQVVDILSFLQSQHEDTTSDLKSYIRALLKQANDYVSHIHVIVTSHMDDSNNLDCFIVKAEAAFYRMVNIQLSYTAIALLEKLEANEFEEFNYRLAQAALAPCDMNDRAMLIGLLNTYIQEQAHFTARELLSLRYHKVKGQSTAHALFRQRDHSPYYGGKSLDKAKKDFTQAWQELNWWNVCGRFIQLGSSFCKAALLTPWVKVQQQYATTNINLIEKLIAEELAHFEKAVLTQIEINASIAEVLSTPIDIADEIKELLSQSEVERLFQQIALQRLEICGRYFEIPDFDEVQVAIDPACRIGQASYLPSVTDLDEAMDKLTLTEDVKKDETAKTGSGLFG